MNKYTLRYNYSAANNYDGWEKNSLPIGNSFMGMSIFGSEKTERLQFNEKTLWTGGPSTNRKNYRGGNLSSKSFDRLKQIQTLLENGASQKEINVLAKTLVGLDENEGYGNYQNFGDIFIDFDYDQSFDNYERGLSLNDATAYVQYKHKGIMYSREYFASFPDKAIVGKIYAEQKGMINCNISLKPAHESIIKYQNNEIVVVGELEDNGLKFYAKLKIITDGGILTTSEKSINIRSADSLTLILSAATDYENSYPKYRGQNPEETVSEIFSKINGFSYEKLKQRHFEFYQPVFNRSDLTLTTNIPSNFTHELLYNYKHDSSSNDSKYLEMLVFQYGRYLLISSSMGETLPANLQGVWNSSNQPPWGSDYHLNVNLQMNYWHAYNTNISECALPLLDYIDSLREPGRVTAMEYHNVISSKEKPENGWITHVQNTPFGWTCPGWDFYWGWSPASTCWILQNCYDYFLFTKDMDMLKEKIYPMIKENTKFFLQTLIFSKSQDRFVSSPSYSPEHGIITVGNTYEQQLIHMLFGFTLEAGKLLNDDDDFLKQVEDMMQTLKPFSLSKLGLIKEWQEEDSFYHNKFTRFLNRKKYLIQNQHRHASHLLGLYPATQIDKTNKALMTGAIDSLMDRGFKGTGWSRALKLCLWARTGNGENSYLMLKNLIGNNLCANLWDLHPPFQIDGNFGATAGMAEMLLFSDKYIEFLPSLPANWANGQVKGLCARGGFVFDFKWENSKLTSLTAITKYGGDLKILKNSCLELKNLKLGFDDDGEYIAISLPKNQKVVII